MTDLAMPDAYAETIAPMTLKIQRVLPGTVERVWAYLTQSDLRRQWLAEGEMELTPGAPFTFTWRNDELTGDGTPRPEGQPAEHSAAMHVIAVDPPRHLSISWGENGEVSFDLEQRGDRVLLTLIHKRAPNRNTLRGVSAGWHAHLDLLVARVSGARGPDFWPAWTRLRAEYDARLPQ